LIFFIFSAKAQNTSQVVVNSQCPVSDSEFMKSFIKKINYPQQLLEKRIGGIVYAGFTVDT